MGRVGTLMTSKFSLEGLIKNGLAMLVFGLIVAWFARRVDRAAA